jgi:RHS repeat-associated protein
MNPHPGIWDEPANVSGYWHASPTGDGGKRTHAHLRGRRWLHTHPTANYLLLTANSSFTFSAKERDSETGLSYFGSRYYSSDLSVWLSVDPMSDKYASLSPYVYCADNPVKLVDPNGEEVWHPDGEGGLIGDQGDDFSTLQKYLSTIYGSPTAISEENWNNYYNQILEYQSQNNSQDISGMKLYSSDGTFDNLVGKFLTTMCKNDPAWGLGPFESNNCSPTTFMRIDKATEFVYGQDLLGDISWENPTYRDWQGDKKSTVKFGTSVVVDKGLGTPVSNFQNGLKPGALLRLVGKSSWHSAIFIDYVYSDNQKIGFRYWDQNYNYIHTSMFNGKSTYKVSKAVDFY